MVKVHILGGAGSGKTTLARCIASSLQIPHYDLDKVNWKQENQKDEVAIAEQPAWVTEGIYLIFTEAMLYHADYIVVLNASWPVLAQRMVRRHVLNSLRGTQAYPGLNGIKLLIKLMQYSRCYCLNQCDRDIPAAQSLHAFINEHAEIANPPTKAFIDLYVAAYGELVAPPTSQFVTDYLTRYQEKVIVLKNNADRKRFLELIIERSGKPAK